MTLSHFAQVVILTSLSWYAGVWIGLHVLCSK